MRTRSSPAAWVILTTVLVGVLYPALVLHRVVAPEASLRGQAPWRAQWGPFPSPPPEQVRAATELGTRLSLLERDLVGLAVWNPWVGGGRPGWLASAREGGAPLPLLAVLLARPGHAWTGLIALQVTASFLSCLWMLRRFHLEPWPAAIGAMCYALSGPVASHWLDWQGSALALGPLAVAVAAGAARRGLAHSLARWALVLAVLGLCGPSVAPFVALAAAVAVLRGDGRAPASRALVALLLGGTVAGAVLAPRAWLLAVGREPGAPVLSGSTEPRLAGLARVVLPPPQLDPAAPPAAQRAADGRGFVGLGALALAAIGLLAGPVRPRAIWGGALLVALGASLAPDAWLRGVGLAQRPLGIVALAAATLTAFGVGRLLRGLDEPSRSPVALALAGLLLWSLLPVAARHIPYATPSEAALPAPLPPASSPADGRIVGLLGCLPPDVGAAAGLPDVRASFFDGEPRYAALLGAGSGGTISVTRALAPSAALLGIRTLVEPLPVRVVSGEAFSRVEIADVIGSGDAAGLRRYTLRLDAGACRLGLPTWCELTGGPWLQIGRQLVALAADPALAAESDQWRWFGVPVVTGPTAAELVLAAGAPSVLPVALDHSGLRLISEAGGARVWAWEQASAFASLTWPPGDTQPRADRCPGAVAIREAATDRLAFDVTASGPCTVLVQVKYRPALWQARVNGQAAQVLPCAEVWSCVPVSRGASTLELSARLPWVVKALALSGLLAIAGLAWVGRKT
ncbi:MAG: hypothetical protein MUF10_10800 [Thermoanaerobaculaceae bacterium]|nr:hypothetical protein [Thermoanaerobaculaceae bacterium]